MAFTNINGEDRLVQATFAAHLQKVLGWESVYAWNDETAGWTLSSVARPKKGSAKKSWRCLTS